LKLFKCSWQSPKRRQQDFFFTYTGNDTKYSSASYVKPTLHLRSDFKWQLYVTSICTIMHHSPLLWDILQCFETLTSPS